MSGTIAKVSEQIPMNDVERLIFYTELLVANASLLISDLTSVKYSMRLFSSKTRAEVQQKLALLQSIQTSFDTAMSTYKELEHSIQQERNRSAQDDLAVVNQIVCAEHDTGCALHAINSNTKSNPCANVTASDNNFETGQEHANAVEHMAQLGKGTDEDEEERAVQLASQLAQLRCTYNNLCDRTRAAESNCQHMRQVLCRAQHTQAQTQLQCDESIERARIHQAAKKSYVAHTRALCQSETPLLQSTLKVVQEGLNAIRSNCDPRQKQNEVEVAAYQIMGKEEQARCEALQDRITSLQQEQMQLELDAKRQEVQLRRENSLVRLLCGQAAPVSRLWGGRWFGAQPRGLAQRQASRGTHEGVGCDSNRDSNSKRNSSGTTACGGSSSASRESEAVNEDEDGESRNSSVTNSLLTPEQEREVRDDHACTAALAAQVNALCVQQDEVVGILIKTGARPDDASVVYAMKQIRRLLAVTPVTRYAETHTQEERANSSIRCV